MEDFKSKLNALPDSIYAEIAEVFARHGVENVEIKGVEVMPTEEITNKAECEARGGTWVCNNRPGKPPYCRCLGATS